MSGRALQVWARTLAWVMAVGLAAALAMTLAADHADARRPVLHGRWLPVIAPRVVTAGSCTGVLTVTFDAVTLTGVDWWPRPDDGHTVLELHETSGRSGPGGEWRQPPAEFGPVMSGGEHRIRWAGWAGAVAHGMHYDMARVGVSGYRSMPALIESGCAG